MAFFHLVEEREHACSEFIPCVKKEWVCQKTQELMEKRGKVMVTELKNWFIETYGTHIEKTMLSRAIAQVRNESLGVKLGFYNLTSFTNELSRCNAGTTTSIVSPGGVFQRAFLALGMCVQSFQHTTRFFGLDVCHVKAGYGGVLLVMTVLDGNGHIYPSAIAIAEGKTRPRGRGSCHL